MATGPGILPPDTYLRARWLGAKLFDGRRFRAAQRRRQVVTDTGYSFKPFDDTRSIFIHIPKCAGLSVAHALYGNRAGGHLTLDEYLRIFEPAAIRQYFKFTFVRNPWDRLVSAFHFLKAGGISLRDQSWANGELGPYAEFDTFVRHWLNEKNIWKFPHFHPQTHFALESSGHVTLEFVGRFENLAEDFAHVAGRLGTNATLAVTNPSAHAGYRDYYSETARERVGQVYARDIAQFSYTF